MVSEEKPTVPGKRIVKIKWKNGEAVGVKWRIPIVSEVFGKKDPCVYCLEPSDSWEHITPKSDGGRNHWDNLARACFKCNHKRGSKPLALYLLEIWTDKKEKV